MKTVAPAAAEAAPAPAGNLTLAGLKQTLMKKVAAPAAQTETTETQTETETTEQEVRETPAGNQAATEVTDSAALSQTDVSESDENTESHEGHEGGEGEDETETGERVETDETEAEPEKPQLPEELRDAIEIAKGDGKKGVASLLGRVHKLTDQRDTERNKRLVAEERVTQLETEITQARERADDDDATRSIGQTGTVHPAVKAISTQLDQVERFRRLLKANPDGMEMDDGAGGTVTLSAEDVSEHLEKLRDTRTQLLARKSVAEENVRQQYQSAFHQVRAESVKLYPWLADENAPEQVRMRNVLKMIPGLKAVPDYERLIARMFKGAEAEAAEAKAKAKPAGSTKAVDRKPTNVNTGTPGAKAGAVSAKSKAEKEVADAKARFEETGTKADLQKWEAAKQRAKRLS